MDLTQTRLLLVMSGLLVAIATALYLGKDAEEPADEDATAQVWTVDPTTATKIEVARPSGTFALEKRDEGWFVTAPADAADRADDDQVRDLLDSLRQVKLGIPVDGAAAHAGDFGLGDPPQARVTLTLPDGAQPVLDVGVEAPVGFRTYVRGADGTISAVSGDLTRPLGADVGRYRDHRVLRFDAGAVRDIVIAGPDGTLHVHGERLDWFIDGFGRADPDRVDDLVVGLLGLRYDELLDAAEAPIDAPRYSVRVTSVDGAVTTLETGSESEEGVIVAASDGRRGRVWPDAVKQLGRGPRDLGLELLFGIHIDTTDSVKISAGGRSVEAHRNGAAWEAPGMDAAATYAWVAALSTAKATLRREPPPPPDPVELTVEMRAGDRAWTVLVGPADAEGFRSARDAAADSPVRIPAPAVDEALAALQGASPAP